MLSVQLGSALSVHLIWTVGSAGTAWLRLSMGALIFLALARPPLRHPPTRPARASPDSTAAMAAALVAGWQPGRQSR